MSLPINHFINKIICGDAYKVLKQIPSESIDCVVTSPPYFQLRDYGVKGQLGLESSYVEYIARLCNIFDEIKRVLKSDGTCWVNMGDTYFGDSPVKKRSSEQFTWKGHTGVRRSARAADGIVRKCLAQIPSRFAIEMTNRGWILRNELIWHKPNCMPQSVKDRFTVDFEKLFFFVKSRKYYFEQQFEAVQDEARLNRRLFNPNGSRKRKYGGQYISAINPHTAEASRQRMLEHGRNKRSVWRIATSRYLGNHFAVYPPELIETPIKAGCPMGGIVLDPFIGSGTTALVTRKLGRNFIGIDMNREYTKLAADRLKHSCMPTSISLIGQFGYSPR